ncbi:endonuclease/exonuclease/phosphatase family protein [Amycolatopsis endophytica]|uniref:Endonuclease/exonuclease/phosphatase family metal-dependent hydrolase n=1 Tax=Amycolatopsis endophytica TaxID=860233 RepID=A0A853B2V6_9PSEU|nr:endonuclease/exonuclease/phosphatase family protein [Amycolatopsis endophytica]NYI89111.1 endonuclease/exonuclease/phosphatase family metal-dependent hydrolase [Amycolatopsis endophytica]
MSDMTRRGALGIAGAGAVTLMAAGGAQAQPGGKALIGRAGGDTLHVTTFNIRMDAGAAPGTPDSWTDRRPVLARFLEIEQPTVLGIQEGLYHQVKQVAADLPKHYEWIGLGREGGGRGEFMTIYYDTRRVEPLDYDHFWLSDTPYVIGSASWGNTVVRMVTWVRFRDSRTGKEFVHVNTHFDHQSEPSRQRSATLVRDRISGFDPALPVVLTGDFNTPADSVSYRTLTDSGLSDAWRTAAKQLTPEWGTFPNYREPVLNANRIDWILTNPRVSVLAAAINTFRVDGRYPSDHVPVQALVRLI